jgi:hypothetical protein
MSAGVDVLPSVDTVTTTPSSVEMEALSPVDVDPSPRLRFVGPVG